MTDELKTDIALRFGDDGSIDLNLEDTKDETVSGKNNLVQALKLRLLMYRGDLSEFGHPRHGTVIQDFIGEPMTRANLELIKRYVKKALIGDPRVSSVDMVIVEPRTDVPGAVDVDAVVTATEGSQVELDVTVTEN